MVVCEEITLALTASKTTILVWFFIFKHVEQVKCAKQYFIYLDGIR